MLLMTKELEAKLENYLIGSQDGLGEEAEVLVKYWLLFGYMCIFDWEWGYVMLSELEDIQLPFGLSIEREIYGTVGKVKDYFTE